MRKSFLSLAAIVPAVIMLSPVAAHAATGTTVSMTFTEADGVTPMANATVGVFYMPPSDADLPDGSTFTMTELGSGTTNSSGVFSAAIDSSSIAASDLADVGDGTPDAFNAYIEALDSTGNFAVDYEVLTVNSAFAGTASAEYATGSTGGAPIILSLSGDAVVLAHSFRYVPEGPLNVGGGMQGVASYTVSSSTTRQTEVNVVKVGSNGGFSLGGLHVEQKERMTTAPFKHSQSFHNWLWASYEFKEYRICAQNCGGGTAAVWEPYQFTGDFTDSNPNCCNNGSTIGVKGYSVPPFIGGPEGADWFRFTSNKSGWSRSSGTREKNNVGGTFYFPFAGSIGVNSEAIYGSITRLTYNWLSSGCGTGFSRVIWGNGDAPTSIPRVQGNCFSNGSL